MRKPSILVIGPSPDRSKGGMATVIDEIRCDKELNTNFNIDIYDSYIDGNIFKRLGFSVLSFTRFLYTKKNYDIYHIHAASRGSTFRKGFYTKAVKRWGKKSILHIHGAEYMEFYNELDGRKRKKMLNILKVADMVIALSEDWKQKFENVFGITNCVVLENGINMERLKPAITEPVKHQKEFVCLGQLGKRKGSYDLVKAIKLAKKQVPDIKLYLAGDGEINQVTSEVQKERLQDNIEIIGWADFQKKISLLQTVSTVVLPSYNEGLPMSILEGMACGKAIISSTVGAIPEVITEENGILIEAGDIEALANALVKCATDIEMISHMGFNNMRKIENEFSMKNMHKKLSDYYYNVLEKSNDYVYKKE